MTSEANEDESSMSNNAQETDAARTQASNSGESLAGEQLRIRNTSQFGAMLWIGFYTSILNVITLTLFRFWGRTHFRRRLWADTTINGEPLEYTGTGKELFIGFLLALLTIMLPVLVALIAAQAFFEGTGFALVYCCVYLVLFYLVGAAIFLARRYHLSRIRFRGIRFAQTGSVWGYAWVNFFYTLLNIVTLGWAVPWTRLRLSRRMWNRAYFGSAKINFADTEPDINEPVYKSFALVWLCVLGAIISIAIGVWMGIHEFLIVGIALWTVGIVLLTLGGVFWCWHEAVMIRYILKHLKLDGVSVSSRLGMWGMLELVITNLLILVCTLGFGFMVTKMRLWKRIVNTMEITGVIDFTCVQQTAQESPKSGEGLADGLDVLSNF